MALISTATAAWAATSLDAGWRWDNTASGFATDATITIPGNGTIVIKNGTVTRFNNDGFVKSSNGTGQVNDRLFDLTGSSIIMRAPTLSSPASGTFEAGVVLTPSHTDATNPINGTGILMTVERDPTLAFSALAATNFYRSVQNAGTWTQVDSAGAAFSATADYWWRIRDAGTTIVWETAPDSAGRPGTWVQRSSILKTSIPFAITALQVHLHYRVTGNTDQPAINSATATFYPVNPPQSVATVSSANPLSYTHTLSSTQDTVKAFSNASPATYSWTPTPATSGLLLVIPSAALPLAYGTTFAATSDQAVLSSVALPAGYSHTFPLAQDTVTYSSSALPGAYSATFAAATAAKGLWSNATPAVYAITFTSTNDQQVLSSVATPVTYLTVYPDTAVTTNGKVTGYTLPATSVRPVVPLTDDQFIAWLSDPRATRVVLFEVNAIDTNGNVQRQFFSTKGYVSRPYDTISNQAYLPFILGGLDFQQSMNLDLDGRLSNGDIELDNTEGDLDYLLEYSWQYQSAKAFIGDAMWSRNNFRQIYDGTVEDIGSSNRGTLNVKLRDKLYRLDMPLHDKKIGGAGAQADQLLPVVFGECHNITPVLLNEAALKYAFHVGTAESVFEVRDNGIPVQRSPSIDMAPASFTLVKKPFGRITCSVQGDNGVRQDVTSGYQNSVVGIIYRLVTGWGTEVDKRFTDADIDLANLNQFYGDNQQIVGTFNTERITVLELAQQVAASIGARMVVTAQGKMQLVQVSVPPRGTPIDVTPSDMEQGSLELVDRPLLRPSAKIGYNRNWTVQTDTAGGLPEEHKKLFAKEWLTATAVDETVRSKYRLWGEPEQENTLLITQDDAISEVGRRMRLRSSQRQVLRFKGFADLIFTPVGSAMRITHPRFGLKKGRTGQVLSVAVDWIHAQVTIEVVI